MEQAVESKAKSVNKFRQDLFAKRVREKRANRSLRDVAAELDIGIATLSRVENGRMPDLHNFGILCEWLGDNPAKYFILDARDNSDLTIQLRAAQAMSAETAGAFMEIIRAAYAQVLDHANEDEKV